MRVLIVGAYGFAGSALVRIFSQLGHDCVAIDLNNYAAMVGAEGDVLINANGNSAKYLAERDPVGEIDRSVKSVMQSCADFSADRYVLLSSADVYPSTSNSQLNSERTEIAVEKLSAYGLNKYLAECVVRNRRARWLIVRLGGLLGPGLRKNPIFDLLTGQPLRVHPDSEFGYIHTEEVARIIAHLLQQKIVNEVFNVCGSGMVSVREMAAWVGRAVEAPDPSLPRIRYEIDNKKLATFWRIPLSSATAREFITSWQGAHQNP
ncbi:MAG TPA: NAD(P)-dependent oxidoreductase [Verrucomicrobiae bacterium]|nr:NAD(P)-dependent oxidoreductase [Verrucomicrobiae bacterium]